MIMIKLTEPIKSIKVETVWKWTSVGQEWGFRVRHWNGLETVTIAHRGRRGRRGLPLRVRRPPYETLRETRKHNDCPGRCSALGLRCRGASNRRPFRPLSTSTTSPDWRRIAGIPTRRRKLPLRSEPSACSTVTPCGSPNLTSGWLLLTKTKRKMKKKIRITNHWITEENGS